jgi:hypothetical protein
LLTLYFIGIHVRFAVVHPSMNLAFAKWIEFNAIQRWVSTKSPFVEEIISILTSSFDNEESLVQIIDNVTTIDVPMDLCQGNFDSMLTCLFTLLLFTYFFPDLGDARNLSRAFLSAWLVRGSAFPIPRLIASVLDVLKKDTLPESCIYPSPLFFTFSFDGELGILVVLHMLKKLVIHTPYISHPTINTALSLLKVF